MAGALRQRKLMPHEAYARADVDQSGRVDVARVLVAMRWLGLRPTPADVLAFVALCDDDHDGLLSYRDFERGVAALEEGEHALDVELAPADDAPADDATRAALSALTDTARIEHVRHETELKELAKPMPLAGDEAAAAAAADKESGGKPADVDETPPNPFMSANFVYFDFARAIAKGGAHVAHVTRCGPTEMLIDNEAAAEITAIPEDLVEKDGSEAPADGDKAADADAGNDDDDGDGDGDSDGSDTGSDSSASDDDNGGKTAPRRNAIDGGGLK
jgi:hypothetical protein